MEKSVLQGTGLIDIDIVTLASVEVIGERCVVQCRSQASLTFESGSRLSRIEKSAL
jgi:hypothetical protein